MLSLAEFAGVALLRDHPTDIFKINLWLAALRGSGMFIRPPFAGDEVGTSDRAQAVFSTLTTLSGDVSILRLCTWIEETLGARVNVGIPQWTPETSARPRVGFVQIASGPYYYLEVHPGDRHLLYGRCLSPDADPVTPEDIQVMDSIISTLHQVRSEFQHLAASATLDTLATDLEMEF